MRARLLAAAILAGLAACTTPAKPVDVSGPPSSFQGTWSWVCCNGKYSGEIALDQRGSTVHGSMTGGPAGMGTTVDGTVDGTMLRFTRGSTQKFVVQVDATGVAMRGGFEGEHDPDVATDFVARRLSARAATVSTSAALAVGTAGAAAH